MTELTLRDGMVIVGSLLILAVLIDAWRRMRQQQRANVRLKLASDIPPEETAEDITFYRELPNGGARVVHRGEDNDEDSAADAAVDNAADAAVDGAGATPDGINQNIGESGTGAHDGGAESSATTTPTPAVKAATRKSARESVRESVRESEPAAGRKLSGLVSGNPPDDEDSAVSMDGAHDAMSGMRANDEPANLDWLEDLPELPINPESEGGALPRDAQTEVIVLHVTSREEEGFYGKDILEILLACDLRFGDMDFFHRHEQQAGRGPIQFSVANMLQPGIFDIDNMAGMRTRGLVFFLTLPGPEDMSQAFDYMLETARAVARNLSGDLLDESRSVLTQQSIEHSRQQIRELERRLLTARA